MGSKNILKEVEIDQQELLKKLDIYSQQMKEGNIDSLNDLKDLLDEHIHKLIKLSKQVDPKLLTTMWILDAFISELWNNFGEGNVGFPKEKGFPYIIEISENLGIFIQESLFKKGEPMKVFIKVIDVYTSLLDLCKEEYKDRSSPFNDFCTL